MNYLRISTGEQLAAKRSLLEGEMAILNMLKRAEEVIKLRKVEFELKALLKKQIAEIVKDIEDLEKVLPKTHIHEPKEERKTVKVSMPEAMRKRTELEIEIDEIKQKLATLGA